MDAGRAGIAVLVVLFLISAGLQDPPGGVSQEADPGDFNGCYTGAWCYWSNLPPVLLYGIEAPDPADEMYGTTARNAAEDLIESAERIRVRPQCETEDRRMIARVIVDGRDLSKWMVRHGYADVDRDRRCP